MAAVMHLNDHTSYFSPVAAVVLHVHIPPFPVDALFILAFLNNFKAGFMFNLLQSENILAETSEHHGCFFLIIIIQVTLLLQCKRRLFKKSLCCDTPGNLLVKTHAT